ncbi:hypothetical protein ER57_15275 [Smithella sp. SCADC]|nr:hypothetical protein ER57_15275 [Smithella sp. SCADC]
MPDTCQWKFGNTPQNLHRQTKIFLYNVIKFFIEVKQSSFVLRKLLPVMAGFMSMVTTKISIKT